MLMGEMTPPCRTPVKLTLSGCVVSLYCVGFASLDVVCNELNTEIVRAGGAIWLNPFATVLFSVCSAVTV